MKLTKKEITLVRAALEALEAWGLRIKLAKIYPKQLFVGERLVYNKV